MRSRSRDVPVVYEWYRAKTTINTTPRTVSNAAEVSNAYLANAEAGLLEYERTNALDSFPGPRHHGLAVVLWDNLEYGMEMMVKCAIMVQGVHGPDTHTDFAGIVYTPGIPGHDWNALYHDDLSEVTRFAIEYALREPELLDQLAHHGSLAKMRLGDLIRHCFRIGRIHVLNTTVVDKEGKRSERAPQQSLARDSLRYDVWNTPGMSPDVMRVLMAKARQVNARLPEWFDDPTLGVPETLQSETDYEAALYEREQSGGGRVQLTARR